MTDLNPVTVYVTDEELQRIYAAQDGPKSYAGRRSISNAVRVLLGWPEMQRGPRAKGEKVNEGRNMHTGGPSDGLYAGSENGNERMEEAREGTRRPTRRESQPAAPAEANTRELTYEHAPD